ncbi:hypothetical protein GYB22_05615 [bacterium]|nr:hypothetical protein [bacterium]
MDKKLTLSLNQKIIEQAKSYAKSHNISLSKLIEAYLASLTNKNKKDPKITPLVESLIGVMELPEDYNIKEEYTKHLEKKYS